MQLAPARRWIGGELQWKGAMISAWQIELQECRSASSHNHSRALSSIFAFYFRTTPLLCMQLSLHCTAAFMMRPVSPNEAAPTPCAHMHCEGDLHMTWQ